MKSTERLEKTRFVVRWKWIGGLQDGRTGSSYVFEQAIQKRGNTIEARGHRREAEGAVGREEGEGCADEPETDTEEATGSI
jgi:hypothetical protein